MKFVVVQIPATPKPHKIIDKSPFVNMNTDIQELENLLSRYSAKDTKFVDEHHFFNKNNKALISLKDFDTKLTLISSLKDLAMVNISKLRSLTLLYDAELEENVTSRSISVLSDKLDDTSLEECMRTLLFEGSIVLTYTRMYALVYAIKRKLSTFDKITGRSVIDFAKSKNLAHQNCFGADFRVDNVSGEIFLVSTGNHGYGGTSNELYVKITNFGD